MFRKESIDSCIALFGEDIGKILKKAKEDTSTEKFLLNVRDAYHHIGHFIKQDRKALVNKCKFSHARPSYLIIEVRKDLLWSFKDSALKEENLATIASVIARSIIRYLSIDKQKNLKG